jgi:hypothetical protein
MEFASVNFLCEKIYLAKSSIYMMSQQLFFFNKIRVFIEKKPAKKLVWNDNCLYRIVCARKREGIKPSLPGFLRLLPLEKLQLRLLKLIRVQKVAVAAYSIFSNYCRSDRSGCFDWLA